MRRCVSLADAEWRRVVVNGRVISREGAFAWLGEAEPLWIVTSVSSGNGDPFVLPISSSSDDIFESELFGTDAKGEVILLLPPESEAELWPSDKRLSLMFDKVFFCSIVQGKDLERETNNVNAL